ncbi:SPOR domain-containing protein [Zeaxanthinibacter enoshimensis]|uniref:HU domain-containing protein n=1 Tax=Zeaxanthinibacter enoshimensis TaxID=392009 RepID=UPI0035673123
MSAAFYIEELLYRYNCVIVPGFGAFLTQMKSAVLHKTTNTFDPPSKVISFNQQLDSNDGLLVSYIAHAENTTYDAMLEELSKTVKKWKEELETQKTLKFGNLGEFRLNREGRLLFRPANQVNFLTASFGLSSVVSPQVTREVLKEEVQELEERIPFIITPEERKKSNFRPYLKYAAILLLAFSTGVTGFRMYQTSVENQQMARQQAHELVQKNIQEATFFSAAPLELPAISLNVTRIEEAPRHHVIAGAFRYKTNADKKVRQLKRKGFDSAAYLGTNSFGLHQVVYASFVDSQEALDYLKTVKENVSRDAWLLSKK